MPFFAFFLGLAIGIGFWVWQQLRLNRQLRQLLRSFSTDTSEIALPLIPRLRREITLSKQQQRLLKEQLQTYQQQLDFAPVGYLQVDEENQLLWCNQQARQMLSLEKWQLGQVRLLLELVRSYELDELIEQTRDRQQPQQREWVFHPACADAAAMVELRLLTLRGSSLPLPEGQVAVFLENLQPLVDMTEARDRAFSDLAHELRTPLTSIRLVVENLQPRLEPPLNRWVERLLPEVDRLIDLVQNWLELTQLEIDPNKKLNRHPVEVRSLIQSVWQTLEPLARRRQLNFAYLGQENVWIRADESRIYQVFLNLLDNSIKYSCVEGHIHVEVKILPSEDAAKTVQVNIIDSGSGFPDKDLPYVFERFYRGDQARARPSSVESKSKATFGSGLGLAIVRQIVLAHGGSVKAMNHPDTGGAWIIVELPEVMADSNS